MTERSPGPAPELDDIRLEVKTSRSDSFPITARDLEGPGPDGYVAALLTSRRLHGPRWVLVPVRRMSARAYGDKEMAELAAPSRLVDEINLGWSDWLLDATAFARLLEEGIPGLPARVPWCRREHPPHRHGARGNVRELKLWEALASARAAIDGASAAESGAQAEGQVHQALLEDVLAQLGYRVLPNPVGVPDIVATRAATATGAGSLDRLAAWQPQDERLRAAREALMKLGPEEIESLLALLRQGHAMEDPSPARPGG
jgi:hypothetical protein